MSPLFDAENKVITYLPYCVDISIAVSSPSGLVVPVLRNCEDMSFAGVSAIRTAGRRPNGNQHGRRRELHHLNGGSWLAHGRIDHQRRAVILNMHGIFKRPYCRGRQGWSPMMYVALTHAHTASQKNGTGNVSWRSSYLGAVYS
jgi:2-oxoglutarate dehydrogenase E2 component (dihydrolipoamide succinyltransferase)